MEEKLQELKSLLSEVYDLVCVSALLNWDQTTYMPQGGAAARGRQRALISRLLHERGTHPRLGQLLEALQPYGESLPYDSDEASLIRVAQRDFERKNRVPSAFMETMTEHFAATYQAWAQARPADDFSIVEPYLEKTLELSRQYAQYFEHDHPADPLIELNAREGMKAAEIRQLFNQLREELVPMVKKVSEQSVTDDACLRQSFPEERQWDFGIKVIERLGYDFSRGRQDRTRHPFCTKFSVNDVRITTRFTEDYLGEGLFCTIHEAGHAMYEQGVKGEFEGTPLARGTSSGVHESQSRLWENIVGRSRGFWEYFYPQLQQTFPDQLQSVSLDTFYRAINRVKPSLIRTAADELTYNLHVMIRFDLELDLLEGKLAVKDLPEAWRERYKSDLGVFDPGDKNGVLQDVHWHFSTIGGMFQGYTLGNILSAQFYEAAVAHDPSIPDQIRQGNFAPLYGWLRENIYQHGRKYTATELVKRATGSPLTIDPYVRYLKQKYGEWYAL